MLCCASYAEGHTNLGAIRGHIYISYQITMILNLHLSTQKHRYLFRCPNSFLRVIDTSHMPSNIIFLIPPFFPSFQTASPTPREINSARLCPTQDFVFEGFYISLRPKRELICIGKWGGLFFYVFIQQTLKCLLWTWQDSSYDNSIFYIHKQDRQNPCSQWIIYWAMLPQQGLETAILEARVLQILVKMAVLAMGSC